MYRQEGRRKCQLSAKGKTDKELLPNNARKQSNKRGTLSAGCPATVGRGKDEVLQISAPHTETLLLPMCIHPIPGFLCTNENFLCPRLMNTASLSLPPSCAVFSLASFAQAPSATH